MVEKLTPRQLTVLMNLAHDPHAYTPGRQGTRYGRSAARTLCSLVDRGFVVWDVTDWRITEAGASLLLACGVAVAAAGEGGGQ